MNSNNVPKWLNIVYKVLQFLVSLVGGVIGGSFFS